MCPPIISKLFLKVHLVKKGMFGKYNTAIACTFEVSLCVGTDKCDIVRRKGHHI